MSVSLETESAASRLSLRLILRSIAKQCVSKDGAAPWFETLACATLRQAPHHEAGRERAKIGNDAAAFAVFAQAMAGHVATLAALLGLIAFAGKALAAGDRALGEYLSSECVTCHQLSGRYQGIPPIIGWPEQSFVEIMDEYRSKRRSNPVMQTIAAKLSAEEVAALAAYFGSVKPKN